MQETVDRGYILRYDTRRLCVMERQGQGKLFVCKCAYLALPYKLNITDDSVYALGLGKNERHFYYFKLRYLNYRVCLLTL